MRRRQFGTGLTKERSGISRPMCRSMLRSTKSSWKISKNKKKPALANMAKSDVVAKYKGSESFLGCAGEPAPERLQEVYATQRRLVRGQGKSRHDFQDAKMPPMKPQP